MIEEWFSRTRMLLGGEAVDRLAHASVAVFGTGGVGGYVVEVLARSGVGRIDIYDNDRIAPSNLNRQIHALTSTLGQLKADVAAARARDINPACDARAVNMFYLPECADEVDLSQYDYVADCIDTVKAKIELARCCTLLGVPIIASMGAAYKLDPTAFRVADISKTKIDPLAKVLRKKLRKIGILHLKTVYSEEEPRMAEPPAVDAAAENAADAPRKKTPASCAFVPAAAGIIIGGEIVKDLIKEESPSDE